MSSLANLELSREEAAVQAANSAIVQSLQREMAEQERKAKARDFCLRAESRDLSPPTRLCRLLAVELLDNVASSTRDCIMWEKAEPALAVQGSKHLQQRFVEARFILGAALTGGQRRQWPVLS